MKHIRLLDVQDPVLDCFKANPSLWQGILDYDLSIVTKTFAERNPKYRAQAVELELECKRFMYLAALAPEIELAPTKPIDDYWHQFVLFTQEYERFCQNFAGHFVHHMPLAGPDHETIFVRTQRFVVKMFGEFKNRHFWFRQMPATSCKAASPRFASAC